MFRKLDPNAVSDSNQPHRSDLIKRKLTLKAIEKGLETLLNMIVAGSVDGVDLSHEDRVPRFWADD